MCLQCLCNPDVFNRRIGPFVLMRATKDPYPNDENPVWTANQFGLVECNDPTFFFTTLPVKVKHSWLLKSSDDDSDEWFAAHDAALSIQEEIVQSAENIESVLRLVREAIVDLSTFTKYDVSMAIMKVLYEALESGFKTDAEFSKEIQEANNEVRINNE